MTIREELDRLGKLTADEIAVDLFTRGIRGRKKLPARCPVSNDLRECGATWVVVAADLCAWQCVGSYCTVNAVPPESVGAFIVAFDAGKYSELEAV